MNASRPAATSIRFLILATSVVVLALATRAFLLRSVSSPQAAGQSLLKLSLQPLSDQGQHWDLDSLRGKTVLLNFWGTWCGPCRVEMPKLIALAKEFEDRDNFVFLPVSCPNSRRRDINTAKSETQSYLDENNFDILTYYDRQAATRLAVAGAMGLGDNFSYPTTIILDGDGKIQGFWQGYSPTVIDGQRKVLNSLLDH
jgi:cytochrome c-type biogenesis protein